MTDMEFFDDYDSCREAFLSISAREGARIISHEMPGASGPKGRPLCIDVAVFGRDDAPRLLFVTSGIHGVEGVAGANAQIGWMRRGGARAAPADLSVVLVHAINPWGFAYLSRSNENNVDLNRNFLSSADIPITRPEYPEFHEAMRLCGPGDGAVEKMQRDLGLLREKYGAERFMTLASGGQYAHADGINFGGDREEWSTRIVRGVFDEVVKRRSAVALIDYHSGLGEFGRDVFLVFDPPGSAARARAMDWYGVARIDDAGKSADDKPADYTGLMVADLKRRAAPAAVTAVVIEFGTYPVPKIVRAICRENWLRRAGAGPREGDIVEGLRRVFAPDDAHWRASVLELSAMHFDRAIAGLSREAISVE